VADHGDDHRARHQNSIFLDILGFGYGRAEVSLLSSGVLHPFPAAIQQRLFMLLLTRAKTHTL